MPSAHRDSFTSYFLGCMVFLFFVFFFLFVLVRTLMLNKSRYLCCPWCWEKSTQPFTIKYDAIVSFSLILLSRLRNFLLLQICWVFFFIRRGYWTLSNVCFCFTELTVWFSFSFYWYDVKFKSNINRITEEKADLGNIDPEALPETLEELFYAKFIHTKEESDLKKKMKTSQRSWSLAKASQRARYKMLDADPSLERGMRIWQNTEKKCLLITYMSSNS